MTKYFLAIDQGTTGTTALLLDSSSLSMKGEFGIDYPQIYPQPGWVEHDLNTIWDTVGKSVQGVLNKCQVNAKEIAAIGITNQRETTCAYDKTGKPLYHAIVWQDRRTHGFCQEKKSSYAHLSKKTGLPLDPYFSGTKMKWLLDNVPAVKEAQQKNQLNFSTIDSFVLYKLTNGESFYTEPTNASRTLLMNLSTMNWDYGLLQFFGISENTLPKIKETFGSFGITQKLSFLPDGIPITCLFGDQQSALFGQGCTSPGDLKCTYGTGAFLLLQTGPEIIYSQKGLLTTASYYHKQNKNYALEGSCYIAGAAVQWLRDNLSLIPASSEVEKLASSIKSLDDMKYLLFFPFFSGIGTPHWKAEAKAAIVGMTRDTSGPHLARACLDGIALSITDCIKSFQESFPNLKDIKVDGGASQNNLLMQIQSSFSQKTILRPKNIETTSMGAALGAMVGMNALSIEDVKKSWKLDASFNPEKNVPYFHNKKIQWDEWVNRLYLT